MKRGPYTHPHKKSRKETGCFLIKSVPSPHIRPLLVFVNGKSGSNQGNKLLKKLFWLLNPRQIFDVSREGPRKAYDLKSFT